MLMILAALLLCCAFTDLLRGKIYNLVVFSAVAAGAALRLSTYGWGGISELLYLMVIPFLILLPFWLFTGGSGIGAGDIKLFTAVAVLVGKQSYGMIFMLSFLAAALLALGTAISNVLHGSRWYAGDHRGHMRIPLAAAILAGCAAYYGGRM